MRSCGGVRRGRGGRAGHVVALVVAVAVLIALILVADAEVHLRQGWCVVLRIKWCETLSLDRVRPKIPSRKGFTQHLVVNLHFVVYLPSGSP